MESDEEGESGNKVSVCVEDRMNTGQYQTRSYKVFISSRVKTLSREEIKRIFYLAKQIMEEK